jgi:hypothetical protein
MTTDTDYLVIGCGATALAFVDALFHESDATFTIIDRRHAPGGHWNDAYPFVRLHQPSDCYGVTSRPLGNDRIDDRGFNKGLSELATGTEVTEYFHAFMRDVLLPSGRVSYHPLTEHNAEGELVGLLSGKRWRVHVRKKLVDATLTETRIPLTHRRKFGVAPDVTCIPPNDLPRIAPSFDHFAVLGAGKTACDSALFLLANGVPAEAISWVIPRDPWFVNRACVQSRVECADMTLSGLARQCEIFASAESLPSLAERMNEAELWLRLDENVWPTMMHGATVTAAELEALRHIGQKVRLGRVQSIERGRVTLERGAASLHPDTLYIDCTASALANNVHDTTPVFAPDKIALQMVRLYQPTFSAALIGHLEAATLDEDHKRALTEPSPMTDTLDDWLASQVASLSNQLKWAVTPPVASWMSTSRLNAFGAAMASIQRDDAERWPLVERIRRNFAPAEQNLRRLWQASGRAV